MASFEKYKLKNGKTKWKVSGYLGIDKKTGKKRIFRKKAFNSKTEAKIEYERAKHGFNLKQSDVSSKRMTFNELFKEFMPYYADTGVAIVTQAKLEMETNKHIIPIIGDHYIDEITLSDLQGLVSHVKERRKDYRKVLGHARSIFKYAVHMGYLDDNPMTKVTIHSSKIEYPQRRVKHSDNFYTTDQMLTFLEYYRNNGEFYQYVYFRLLAFTGLRRGEALGLKVGDIDSINQSITINRIVAEGEKGSSVIRNFTKTEFSLNDTPPVIYLDQHTFEVLVELANSKYAINNQGNEVKLPKREYIFTSFKTLSHFHRSAPNDWLRLFWKQHKEALENLGLHYISPHGFRHSQATMLHELGVSLKDAQHRLRHKNIKTTSDIYTHISKDRERLAANKLNSLNQNSQNGARNGTKIIQFPG